MESRLDELHDAASDQLNYLRRWWCGLVILILMFVIVIPILATELHGGSNFTTASTNYRVSLTVVLIIAVAVAIVLVIALFSLNRIIAAQKKIYELGLDGKYNPERLTWGARVWRSWIQAVIEFRSDVVNRYRLTRVLQVSVPLLQPVEAYLLDRFIGALEQNYRIPYYMEQCLKNKNVGRIIVQSLPMFDILWHNSTRLEWIRVLDLFGDFPTTETQAATFGNVLALLVRDILGRGHWYTRYITGNRQELAVDGSTKDVHSQNLAVGSAFESAARATHGALIGREKVKFFRDDNRLPTDETIVRNFNTNPSLTIADNGFEHVMRAVVKHWNYTLTNLPGNFAHQRQELLDPPNSLRLILPDVLTQLIALRGINKLDHENVCLFIKQLELIHEQPGYGHLVSLLHDFRENIVQFVCGGVPSRIKPLRAWANCLIAACSRLEEDAKLVIELIDPVKPGIQLGIKVIEKTNLNMPTDAEFKQIIFEYIQNPEGFDGTQYGIHKRMIVAALDKLAPKDKRTLYDFCEKKIANPRSHSMFTFLIKRTRALLKREIFRYRFSGEIERLQEETQLNVASAIADAQKAWMFFELNHLKRFAIGAYLDHSELRGPLRDLQVVSQLQCMALDEAKINNIQEARGSTRIFSPEGLVEGTTYWFRLNPPHGRYHAMKLTEQSNSGEFTFTCEQNMIHKFVWKDDEDAPPRGSMNSTKDLSKLEIYPQMPQDMRILGGGPTGLLTALHCCENVARLGGTMFVCEKRDSFESGGSPFQRAQIVRLDPRWISMLRYHLGTRFEDIFVPLDGETMAHLSNFLIDMGFVELTTKQLEDIIQYGVALRRSAGLLRYNTEATIEYKWQNHSATTSLGQVKVGDAIRDFADPATGVIYDYAVVTHIEERMKERKSGMMKMDDMKSAGPVHDANKVIEMKEMKSKKASEGKRRKKKAYPTHMHLECYTSKGTMKNIFHTGSSDEKVSLDLRSTNLVSAKGKGAHGFEQFRVSTYEPYGVSCLAGAKVSHNMHQMGVPRWKNHLVNDIRTIVEDNTRLIGDFTKVISTQKIAERMKFHIESEDWRAASAMQLYPSNADAHSAIYPMLAKGVNEFFELSPRIFRQQVQGRVFETGDNSYLGMEVPREFGRWQQKLNDSLKTTSQQLGIDPKDFSKRLNRFTAKLFFQGAFDVLQSGDVFNPGAKNQVPVMRLVDSVVSRPLHELNNGDAFLVKDKMEKKHRGQAASDHLRPGRYEMISRGTGWLCTTPFIVRDMEGRVFAVPGSIIVYRANDFSRAPDGITESKVAFSTFPVAHYVNHAGIRRVDAKRQLVYIPVGDAQSTPHFMRYSGLTGACVNAMEMEKFYRKIITRTPFEKRFREYRFVINWSNHEVVTRGTGNNYGEDGFLRPAFTYNEFIKYCFHKTEEYTDMPGETPTAQKLFSPNWLRKFSSALVPRGLEKDPKYKKSLSDTLKRYLTAYAKAEGEGKDMDAKKELQRRYNVTKQAFKVIQVWAEDEAAGGQRITTEASNQPKPLDSIADNQSPEVQQFIAGFTVSAAFAAAGLASSGAGPTAGPVTLGSILGGIVSPITAFASVANASRYLRRNEDLQIYFMRHKLLRVKQALFSSLGANQDLSPTVNPFTCAIKMKLEAAQKWATYDGLPLSDKFYSSVEALWKGEMKEGKAKGNMTEAEAKVHGQHLAKRVDDLIKMLLEELIPDKYQEYTYTKDTLTELVQSLRDLKETTEDHHLDKDTLGKVKDILQDLRAWEPIANASLEDGKVSYGLCRVRSWRSQHLVRVLAYLRTYLPRWLPFPTLAQRTKTLIEKLTAINNNMEGRQNFEKELRDLQEFYYASVEVPKVSLIMVVGAIGGVAAFVQNILILSGFADVAGVNFIVAAIGPITPLVAVIFLTKQQNIMAKCQTCMGIRCGTVGGLRGYLAEQLQANHPENIMQALMDANLVLKWSLFTNFMRLVASATSAAALICTLASPDLVLPLAIIALGTVILSWFGFLHIIYGLLYNLEERAPAFICEAFKTEILETYQRFLKSGATRSARIDNRSAWEYTARNFLHVHRFDTIFDAARVNSILQYIQSGMDITKQARFPKFRVLAPIEAKRRIRKSTIALPTDFPEKAQPEELEAGRNYSLLLHGRMTSHRFLKIAGNKYSFMQKSTGFVSEFTERELRGIAFQRLVGPGHAHTATKLNLFSPVGSTHSLFRAPSHHRIVSLARSPSRSNKSMFQSSFHSKKGSRYDVLVGLQDTKEAKHDHKKVNPDRDPDAIQHLVIQEEPMAETEKKEEKVNALGETLGDGKGEGKLLDLAPPTPADSINQFTPRMTPVASNAINPLTGSAIEGKTTV